MAEVGLLPFARIALEGSKVVLPRHRSRFSKHLFTQPQLLAILCLMRYEDWTFREADVRRAALRRCRTTRSGRGVRWSATELGGMLFDSLDTKLLALPDKSLVYPTHGAGSAAMDSNGWKGRQFPDIRHHLFVQFGQTQFQRPNSGAQKRLVRLP